MTTATSVLSLWQGKDALVETAVALVKTFFSPEHVESATGPVKFECKLAPVFPDRAALGQVSDHTKVMVAVANKRLQSSFPQLNNFQDIQGEINSNLQMVMSPNAPAENRSEIFRTEDKSFFEFKGSDGPSPASVQEWIATKLLTNKKVLLASGLDDPKTIQGLITASKSDAKLLLNKVHDETLVADIGILTYPSKDNETISLTNIKIHNWIKEMKIAHNAITKYEVGLRGTYFHQAYQANSEGIKKLKPETVAKTIETYGQFVCEVDRFVYQETPRVFGDSKELPSAPEMGVGGPNLHSAAGASIEVSVVSDVKDRPAA